MSAKSKISAPKIRNVATADLVPYDNNPRDNDDAVDRMVAAIEDFGFRVPILTRKIEVVGDSEGLLAPGIHIEIVDGHLRLKAAVRMELKTVPTIDVSDMTDQQVQAFRIMVNQSVSWAEWNEDRLRVELQAIASTVADSDAEAIARLTGFDNTELEWLMADHKYTPDVAPPTEGAPPVTDAAVDKAQEGLDNQFKGGQTLKEVTCPHCAETFEIDA